MLNLEHEYPTRAQPPWFWTNMLKLWSGLDQIQPAFGEKVK